jgi:hypothetical protein
MKVFVEVAVTGTRPARPLPDSAFAAITLNLKLGRELYRTVHHGNGACTSDLFDLSLLYGFPSSSKSANYRFHAPL